MRTAWSNSSCRIPAAHHLGTMRRHPLEYRQPTQTYTQNTIRMRAARSRGVAGEVTSEGAAGGRHWPSGLGAADYAPDPRIAPQEDACRLPVRVGGLGGVRATGNTRKGPEGEVACHHDPFVPLLTTRSCAPLLHTSLAHLVCPPARAHLSCTSPLHISFARVLQVRRSSIHGWTLWAGTPARVDGLGVAWAAREVATRVVAARVEA